MERSFCLAVSGVWGWQLVKHLQRGLNYWDVFPLKFFLLADLVVFILGSVNEAFLNTSLLCVSGPGCNLRVCVRLDHSSISGLRFSSGGLGSTVDAQPSLLVLFLNRSFACLPELLWSSVSSGDHRLKTTAQGCPSSQGG